MIFQRFVKLICLNNKIILYILINILIRSLLIQEKSQKDKCKDWTYITGIIYNVFHTIEKEHVNDKLVTKVFDLFLAEIKYVNNEFYNAYNNGEYEEIEFPPYRTDDYTQLVSNINSLTTPYNATFNWKEFVKGVLATLVPTIELFSQYFS